MTETGISKDVESREKPAKPLFRVTLMRHEETKYTNKGRDLTEMGEARARATGEMLKKEGHFKGSDVYLAHSPNARAKGTLELVSKAAGIKKKKREIKGIRMSDMPDRAAFIKRVEELDHDQEAIAKDHHTNHDLYEKTPSTIEPNSSKRKRLYRALESVVRATTWIPRLSKNTPHVLAVSHFELITLLLQDVFGIENLNKYNSPSFGEYVHIEAHKMKSWGKIRLVVEYNGHRKQVIFNRRTRSIEPLP